MAEKETKPKAVKTTVKAKTASETKPAEKKTETAAKPAAVKEPKAAPEKPAAKTTVKATAKPAAAKSATAKSASKNSDGAEATAAAKPAPVKASAAKPAEKKAETAAKPAAAKEPAVRISEPAAQSAVAVADDYEFLTRRNIRFMIMGATAFLLAVVILVSTIFGVKGCIAMNGTKPKILSSTTVAGDNPTLAESSSANPVLAPSEEVLEDPFEYEYSATSAVGFSSDITGTVERKKPVAETKNESAKFGNAEYPSFGYSLSSVLGSGDDKMAARNALIRESSYLTATGTANAGGGNYKWMDEDGYLYNGTTANPEPSLNDDGTPRQLYKHTASVGLYSYDRTGEKDVLDSEEGIVKTVTIRPRGYNSYSVTGLYAPAGEVIKVEISEADMNATGGIVIHIGQALYNGQANNIWAEKGQMQRIPHLLNTMVVNKNTATLENGVYTAYVGSFIGGPLYIRNTNATFTATISGAVRYSHFILGYTTKEEFEENKKSSAPYFDLEVWNYGVLHSGPRSHADAFSYEALYKAAIFWEKVASVTTYTSSQGIVFLYEPFVAAGAAVAFPGRSSVNCPAGWMSNSLNYNTLVSSGAWGNLHEYHHNFQGYGVGNGGEVTNNAMTLVSYALFTKISSKRGISGFGSQGLGGWNNYTSATLALEETLKIARPNENPSNGNQGLALYATLLHNFGANSFIQSKLKQQTVFKGQTYTSYMRAWQDVTHNDMSYYFKDILQGVDRQTADEYSNHDYPMFVPVSSVYQTGRSYLYDGEKKYFHTMQPYVIPFGEDFNIDLSRYSAPNGQYAGGSIVIPEDFDYRIKSVTSPEHGSVEIIDNFHLKYTPDKNNKLSGQIIVTLGITKRDRAFDVEDVDLILEFEQSHETNKMTLERTTYSYSADSMYTDADEAYEAGFKGYETVTERNHTNPTQNCNTDIWFYPADEATRAKYPNAPEEHFVHPNTIEVLEGKLYFEEAGKYNIYLRGRMNCSVYYSVDGGQNYVRGATIKDSTVPSNSAAFRPSDKNTYFTLTLQEHSWVYFKEVLIVQSSPTVSYIGLGYGKWTEPMFTMVEKYYDAEGNEVSGPDAEGYDHTTTHYYDYNGHEVTEEEANNAELIAPTGATYVNAYRSSYEFPDNTGFESDYFYLRNYTYTYSSAHKNLSQSYIGENPCHDNFPIENLFDDDLTTVCSSKNSVSEAAPWILTIDLGKVIEANRFVLTGYKYNNQNNKNQTPNSITLSVGETLEDMKEVASFDNGTVNNVTLAFYFEASVFRYYKLVVRKTVEGRFAAIANIEFSNNVAGGKLFTPDNPSFSYGGNWKFTATQSTFGHVYAGEENATMSFKFNGTRLAILSSAAYGTNFEVTIDGVKVSSEELKQIEGAYGASYMTNVLEKGSHTVVIKCTGKANIDSIAVYE